MNFYQPIFRQGESFSPVSSHHLSTVTAQHLQGDMYVLTSLRPHSGLHGGKLFVLRPFLRMWVDPVQKERKEKKKIKKKKKLGAMAHACDSRDGKARGRNRKLLELDGQQV